MNSCYCSIYTHCAVIRDLSTLKFVSGDLARIRPASCEALRQSKRQLISAKVYIQHIPELDNNNVLWYFFTV